MRTFLVIFCTITTVFLAFIHSKPSVVVFDTKKVVFAITEEAVKAHIKEKELKILMNSLKHKIQVQIDSYATKNNVLVLDKKYVKAGGEDITFSVLENLKKEGGSL